MDADCCVGGWGKGFLVCRLGSDCCYHIKFVVNQYCKGFVFVDFKGYRAAVSDDKLVDKASRLVKAVDYELVGKAAC